MRDTYGRAAEVLPLVPSESVVARVDNVVARHELLAAAHGESALRLDGAYHVGPVEFHLNPLLAQGAHWLHGAPGAAQYVTVESGRG